MAKLPTQDPTIAAMDANMENAQKSYRRKYLGMSGIGDECSQKLWYEFRWTLPAEQFNALTLRRFEDGHRTEDLTADRLRFGGMSLTGTQDGFLDFGGHFKGHIDGKILGVVNASKTTHVWEHKAVNDKKFKKLVELRNANEKTALMQWDTTYYAQAVLYMEYGGYSRHYLTCSTAGGREYTAVRTNEDKTEATRLKAKAKRIITSDEPLAKIGDKTFYKCKWCRFSVICHDGEAAERNCRTCLHSTANIESGNWDCDLGIDSLCKNHRYLPGLVPGEVVKADKEQNLIEYNINGKIWRDEG